MSEIQEIFGNLSHFIDNEQKFSNHDLYPEDYVNQFFKTDLDSSFLPKSRKVFGLGYFTINENLYKNNLISDNMDFVNSIADDDFSFKFFIHPTSEKYFLDAIDGVYKYTPPSSSEFLATPSSSIRSLFVKNVKTGKVFIVKVSLFINITNGSRHIDWNSANGQYEHCRILKKELKSKIFSVFDDVGATSVTLKKPINLNEKSIVRFGSRIIYKLGNVFRKIPDDVLNGKIIPISLASATGNDGYSLPPLLNILSMSGIEPIHFIDKLIENVLPILFNLMETPGLGIEPHCQNTLLVLNQSGRWIGKYLYRDFDYIGMDRARYPFLRMKTWSEFTINRPDRYTLDENISRRNSIIDSLYQHFLGNLIIPLLKMMTKYFLISVQQENTIISKIESEIVSKLIDIYPLVDRKSLLSLRNSSPKSNISHLHSIKEIPGKLNRLTEAPNLSEYKRVQLSLNMNDDSEFFQVDGLIVEAKNEVIVNIWFK